MAIILKNKIYKSIFIIFALWVNLFFVVTDVFQIKQPDMTKVTSKMSEFCYYNCSISDKIYSDQISREVAMLWLWNKYIWNYFSFELNDEILDLNEKLYKNPVLLTGVNLFSQNYQALDYVSFIKQNWTWFIFLTHYFDSDEEIRVLKDECEVVEKIDWKYDDIYWIIFKCEL